MENESLESLKRRIRVARGEELADLLLINGKIVCTFTGEILEVPVLVAEGRVCGLGAGHGRAGSVVDLEGAYLSPSFTDAHAHIESSLLTPEGFAEAVVPHGTGATVSDPHEIVNVLGFKGYDYMRRAAQGLPMDFNFTIPSCVPATHMETAGAALGPEETAQAFDRYPDTPGLSEMMNFPGVIYGVDEVLQKVLAAESRGFPVDGHSPGLSGPSLDAYLSAGILTDHECFNLDEVLEKMRRGMWILMREGSAAKNLRDLLPSVNGTTLSRVCIVTDDRHPADLIREGHLDNALRVAVRAGLDPIWALRAVTLNPANLYRMRDRGGIAPGYRADFAVLKDLESFEVLSVYHGGKKVAEAGRVIQAIARRDAAETHASVRLPGDLEEKLGAYPDKGRVKVIGVEPAQITTRSEVSDASEAGAGHLQYAAVIERHKGTGNVGLGFVAGFGLKAGALASSVSHDSHNLVVVGVSPAEIAHAARAVERMGGGLAAVRDGEVVASLPLPVAGLMSPASAAEAETAVEKLNAAAKAAGCALPAPFMTLSFLALPVIPSLKLTDRGLVDVNRFALVPLEAS